MEAEMEVACDASDASKFSLFSRQATAEPGSNASSASVFSASASAPSSGTDEEDRAAGLSDGSGSDDASPSRQTTSSAAAEAEAAPETPGPGLAAEAPDIRKVSYPPPPLPQGRLARLALRLAHLLLFAGCATMTRVILGVRSFLALFFQGAQQGPQLSRPGAKLSWEMISEASDPCEVARAALPVPPPLPRPPPGGLEVSFGPCANLMIYTGGVAACLQRCPNYAEVSPNLRFYGVSCGAFIASSMAADCDILALLPEMIAWTKKFKSRLWGLVGAYSESITAIVLGIFSDPARFERARGRLGIGVTAFTARGPERVPVSEFDTAAELVTTLLGSCYIPVAFETPQWCDKLGPLWDGGILEFATMGDVVVSPYEGIMPDVCPRVPYPRSFTFFPPHECDAVRLFEDGYMDCLRWLEAGAPSRSHEREREFGGDDAVSGLQPLLKEARKFVYDVLWGRTPGCEEKAHQA